MEKNEQVLEGLLKAIKAESDGYNFYMMASSNTEDTKGKETFQILAREELEHMKYLRSQYKAILENGVPDSKVLLPEQTIFKGDNPIFSDNIKRRVADAHMEMSALSIGIQLELNAIKYYREQAELADNTEVKSFYTELSKWESGHYNILLAQQEVLQEEYWAANGFSPF